MVVDFSSQWLTKQRFLWVHFQILDLCDAISDSDIREILANLPDGLEDTYRRVLAKISKAPRHRRRAIRLFRWVGCAKRPLTLKELQEASVIQDTDKSWTADAKTLPDIDALLETCHGLVIRDGEGRTVRFAHHTILQFLTSGFERDTTESEDLFFSVREANLMVARICVSYLSFSDFETTVTRHQGARVNNADTLRRSEPRLIPTAVGIPRPLFQIPYRLLGGCDISSPPNIDINALLGRQSHSDLRTLVEKYALLGYIVRFWTDHTEVMSISDTSYSLLRQLVLEKRLPFEFRPWGPDRHFGDYGCSSCPPKLDDDSEPGAKDLPHASLIHWAATTGHQILFEMPSLLPYLLHERRSSQTLRIACRSGNRGIVETIRVNHPKAMFHITFNMIDDLCCYGHYELLFDILRPNNGFRPLDRPPRQVVSGFHFSTAASKGHVNVLRVLFEYDPDPGLNVIKDALYEACGGGHSEAAELLHESIIKLESDEKKDPLLFEACLAGQVATVKFLLDIEPSHIARSSKLIALPANRNTTMQLHFGNDRDHVLVRDPAAIQVAAARGRHDVVRLLASHGWYAILLARENSEMRRQSLLIERCPPLQIACIFEQAKTACALIDCVADLNARDRWGRTAIDYAACHDNASVIEKLANAKADPNLVDVTGKTPLMHALLSGRGLQCSEALLAMGADASICNMAGRNVLGLAAEEGYCDLIEILLQRDPNLVHMNDTLGNGPLYYAACSTSSRALKILINYQANVHARNARLETPLHMAIRERKYDNVEHLLTRGANLFARDEFDETALRMMDSRFSGPDIVRLMEVSTYLRVRPSFLETARRLNGKARKNRVAIINALEGAYLETSQHKIPAAEAGFGLETWAETTNPDYGRVNSDSQVDDEDGEDTTLIGVAI